MAPVSSGVPKTTDVAAFGWLVVLACIWSSSFLLIKIAVDTIPPLSLTAGRLVLAAILLWGGMRISGERLPWNRQAWGAFAFVGLVGNVIPFTLISVGELKVPSGLAALIMGVMPVATTLLAHFAFPDERLNLRRAIGVCVGFAGVVLLVGYEALAHMGDAALFQLAVVGGAVCYAVSAIGVRTFSGLTLNSIAVGGVLVGAMVMAPVAVVIDKPWTLSPSRPAIVAVICLGVFATAVATLIYISLIRRIGAANFAQVNFLIPAMGLGWGALFLNERPGAEAFFALALILSGIWLVTRR